MTGCYMKCNTGLEWVKVCRDHNIRIAPIRITTVMPMYDQSLRIKDTENTSANSPNIFISDSRLEGSHQVCFIIK